MKAGKLSLDDVTYVQGERRYVLAVESVQELVAKKLGQQVSSTSFSFSLWSQPPVLPLPGNNDNVAQVPVAEYK